MGALDGFFPIAQRPSPIFGRVGSRISSFEACSGFTRVTACRVASPPYVDTCPQGFSEPVTRTRCLGSYRGVPSIPPADLPSAGQLRPRGAPKMGLYPVFLAPHAVDAFHPRHARKMGTVPIFAVYRGIPLGSFVKYSWSGSGSTPCCSPPSARGVGTLLSTDLADPSKRVSSTGDNTVPALWLPGRQERSYLYGHVEKDPHRV